MSSANDPFEGFNRKRKTVSDAEESKDKETTEGQKEKEKETKSSNTSEEKKNEEERKGRSSEESNEKKSNRSDNNDDMKLPFSFPPKFGGSSTALWVLLGVGVPLTFLLFESRSAGFQSSEIDWTTFQHKLLEKGEVEKLVVSGDIVRVFLKGQNQSAFFFTIGSAELLERKLEAAQIDIGKKPWEFVPIQYQPFKWLPLILGVIPGLILFGVVFSIFRQSLGRQSGIFSMGRSKSNLVSAEQRPKLKFNDVAGLDEAKQEIMEFVSFLKNPQKYKQLGAKIPRGALLVGPPGTGKTLLAKATAGEAQVPFFSISGSDFVEMFVGVGPARVRDLFAQARQKAPCIIFIDEIDAVGRQRSKSGISNDERENTLNQLLVEMDGFNTTSSVIVLAGTNRSDVLDKALMRPGRFDRVISIDPPDKKGRIDIFKVHLKNLKLEKTAEEYAERLAVLTPGFSGADIANVCNEAALIAARNGKKSVDTPDFEAAIERVIGGLERKTRVLAPREKTTIAYHEAGHAVAGWFLEHSNPLLKVSIIPRGSNALGYAQYQPKDQYLYSGEQLMDQMCLTMGGRCAEALIFGRISSGAQDDLQKITNSAYEQITRYGMSKKIGLVSYTDEGSAEQPSVAKLYSSETARMIDEEVRELVNAAYKRTYELLEKHKEGLEAVAKRLLEKEVLHEADLLELLGARPFPVKKAEDRATGVLPDTVDTDAHTTK